MCCQQPDLPAGFDEWLQSLCAFDVEDRPSAAAVALVVAMIIKRRRQDDSPRTAS